MNKIFISLSLFISFFLSSFAMAQNIKPECGTVAKFYPVTMTCVTGVATRPLFFRVEINTLMSPYFCAPLQFSRNATVIMTDLSGQILNTLQIPLGQYLFEVKRSGSYFLSPSYNLNLTNCLGDDGDDKGGFSVGN